MVWIKAEIPDETNRYIEAMQAGTNMSKSETVSHILNERARKWDGENE